MPAIYSYLRAYGQETTIGFPLFDRTGNDFDSNLIAETGDCRILSMGNPTGITSTAVTTNTFVPNDGGYAIVLTAAEMEGLEILVYIVDLSNPKKWIDAMLIIDTYGHASSQHPSIGDSTVVVIPV